MNTDSAATNSLEAAKHDEEIVIGDGYAIHVMRCGRGYWAWADHDSKLEAFAGQRSFAVGAVRDKVRAQESVR